MERSHRKPFYSLSTDEQSEYRWAEWRALPWYEKLLARLRALFGEGR